MSKSICADISNSFRRCITNPGFIESLEQDNYKLLKYFIEEHKKTHDLFSKALTSSQNEDKIVKLYAVSYRLEVLIFFALKEIEKRHEDVFDTLGDTFSTAAPGVRRFREILTLRRNEFPKGLTLSKENFRLNRGYEIYQMPGVNIFPYIDHYSPAIEKGKYVPGEIIDFTVEELQTELQRKYLSINIETELYRLYDDIHYLLKFLSLNFSLRVEENKWSNENVIANIYKHEISGPPKFIAYSRKENEDDNIHIYKYEISGSPEFKENEDDNIHMYNVYFADSFKSLANIYNRDSKHEALVCKSLSIMDVFIKIYHHLVFPKLIGELTPELVSLYYKLYTEQMKDLKNSENIAMYTEYVKYMKKQNVKFIFIRHRINIEDTGHANLIVYNKHTNEIEIFDPNSREEYVNTHLKKIYSPEAINKLFGTTNIQYYYIPFQSVQSMEHASNISGKGTCASWTSWFTEQRLKYYEYPVLEVINIILNSEFAPRVSFLITRSPTTTGHTGRYFTELISSYITHIHKHFPYTVRTIFSLFKESGGKKTLLDKLLINLIQQIIDKLLNESYTYTNVLDMYKDVMIVTDSLSKFVSEKDETEYNIGKTMIRLLLFVEYISRDDIVNSYSKPTKFETPLSTYYTGYMSAPSYTHVNPYSKYVDSGVRK